MLELTNLASGVTTILSERLWETDVGNLEDLKSDWQALLEWAEGEINEATNQQAIFDVFHTLNRTAIRFNEDFGANGYNFEITEALHDNSRRKLWEIKHPVSQAIYMGEFERVEVSGIVTIQLKKEVNV